MTEARRAVATLGGGCFWCLEAAFAEVRGVDSVVPGYAGGALPAPTYEQVCSGDTGHAEVVQVTFDPAVIGYADLLALFFAVHDPTTPNRQGADIGTQYRSVIFTHDEAQRHAAGRVLAEMEAARLWPAPIVTEIAPLDIFWPAEAYHRDYYARNPFQGYCQAVIAPKLAKLRRLHRARLKA